MMKTRKLYLLNVLAEATHVGQLMNQAKIVFAVLFLNQRSCESSCIASTSEWFIVPDTTYAHTKISHHGASESRYAILSWTKHVPTQNTCYLYFACYL